MTGTDALPDIVNAWRERRLTRLARLRPARQKTAPLRKWLPLCALTLVVSECFAFP